MHCCIKYSYLPSWMGLLHMRPRIKWKARKSSTSVTYFYNDSSTLCGLGALKDILERVYWSLHWNGGLNFRIPSKTSARLLASGSWTSCARQSLWWGNSCLTDWCMTAMQWIWQWIVQQCCGSYWSSPPLFRCSCWGPIGGLSGWGFKRCWNHPPDVQCISIRPLGHRINWKMPHCTTNKFSTRKLEIQWGDDQQEGILRRLHEKREW